MHIKTDDSWIKSLNELIALYQYRFRGFDKVLWLYKTVGKDR